MTKRLNKQQLIDAVKSQIADWQHRSRLN